MIGKTISHFQITEKPGGAWMAAVHAEPAFQMRPGCKRCI
jgi:hypothetical protein